MKVLHARRAYLSNFYFVTDERGHSWRVHLPARSRPRQWKISSFYVGLTAHAVQATLHKDGSLVPTRVVICGVDDDRLAPTWRRNAPKVMAAMKRSIEAVLREKETHNGKNT